MKKLKVFNACAYPEMIRLYHATFKDRANKPNVLISYYYCTGVVNELLTLRDKENLIGELHLDSGAYSVKDGKLCQNAAESEILLEEYSLYCKLYGKDFDQFYSLDDDFNNPEHNFNYFERTMELLKDSPRKVVPVLHASGEAIIEELNRYIDHGCKVVAIGSNVSGISDDVWVKFQAIRNEKSINIHQFGTIEYKRVDVINNIRPDSCDSSKFIHAATFGCILYLNPDEVDSETGLCKLDKIYLGARENVPDGTTQFAKYKKKYPKFKELLKELELSQGTLLDDTSLQHAFNLHATCEIEKQLNEKIYSKF